MSKKSVFTVISHLPPGISRKVAIDFLQNHQEMIDLNPLVIERHPISPPPHAADDERDCIWWSMTDEISYLPGGLMSGDVTYTCAFKNLRDGMQTHCYAPMSTDIRDRWTVGGTLPGEPPQPVELGLGAPQQGLYIREDVELRCNFLMSSFVRKTLQNSHKKLVDHLGEKARKSGFYSHPADAEPNAVIGGGGGETGGGRPDDPLSKINMAPALDPVQANAAVGGWAIPPMPPAAATGQRENRGSGGGRAPTAELE